MKRLYFSLAAGSQIKTARILQYPYVLVNFMTKTNTPPKYPIKSLFIDSGGFFSSLKHGKYTKSNEEYLNFVDKTKPEFFALRDYPCEPELLKTHKRTVTQHIEMTIEHHLELKDLLKGRSCISKAVPVIQGWEVSDYIYCIDRMNEEGLLNSYTIAIGSVCRRTAVKNIRAVITSIRDELPNKWLHGFGVSLNGLKDFGVWNSLDSSDTGAWDYNSRWKKNRGELPIKDASLICAKEYLSKYEFINTKFKGQTTWQKNNLKLL